MNRWRAFSFGPNTDDIEEYIRDVCMRLQNNLDMVMMQFLTCSKPPCPQSCMAPCMDMTTLYVVMTMLKDIYAKKPQNVVSYSCWSGPRSHSSFHYDPLPHQRNVPKPLLKGLWRKNCLTLWRLCIAWTWMVKPVRKPFKPFITQPRREV